MLGYVTIEVHGADMDGATRHAHRLANNFLEDLETMQKVSRARDRRAMSHFDANLDEVTPSLIHTSMNRYTPSRSLRMGSMPPTNMSTYRSTIKNTDYSLPPVAPRNYYRTYRYTSESPYYTPSIYSGRTTEFSRPVSSNHFSYRHRPTAHTYTHYYPGILNGTIYPSESLTNLSSNVKAERRRIENGSPCNGYGPGLVNPEGSQTSELRGRIKRLLCRSKHDPHYYRYLPSDNK